MLMTSARRRSAIQIGVVGAAVGALAVTAVMPASAAPANKFTVKRLVTDATGAPTVDPSLVNPWGMSQGPNTPVWVSDNGADVSTLYQKGPSPKVPLTVSIPGGAPT